MVVIDTIYKYFNKGTIEEKTYDWLSVSALNNLSLLKNWNNTIRESTN